MNPRSHLEVSLAYRPTPLTESRRHEARAALLRAAREVVRREGFAGITVAAVAERAGLATGSVYRHVESKAALCVEVFEGASQREVDRMAELLAPGDVASLRAACLDWCRRAQSARTLARALISEPVGPEVEAARLRYRQAYATVLAEAIGRAVARGELPPHDAATSAAGIVGALAEAVLGPHVDPVPEHIVTFCLRALGAEEPLCPPTTS